MFSRLHAVGLLAVAPAVALVAPSPVASWASLSSAQDATAPLVGLVGVMAWTCTAWLALLVALVAAAGVPGAVGRVTGRAAARLAPASVRGLVRVALGTTVALTVLGGTTGAHADPRPAAGSSLDWPGAAAPQASPGPSLDWTAPTSAPAPPAPPAPLRVVRRPAAPHLAPRHDTAAPGPTLLPSVRAAVVHRGDSLWEIAARSLGPGATPAQIAQAWPQWWSANRDVIGNDPDLIHPGDTLAPPTR